MPRLMRTMARTAVVAGTASAVSGRVHRRQANRWAAQEQQAAPPPQQAYAEPAYAEPAPAAPSADEKVNMLKQIADLHAQGILTDAEFEVPFATTPVPMSGSVDDRAGGPGRPGGTWPSVSAHVPVPRPPRSHRGGGCSRRASIPRSPG